LVIFHKHTHTPKIFAYLCVNLGWWSIQHWSTPSSGELPQATEDNWHCKTFWLSGCPSWLWLFVRKHRVCTALSKVRCYIYRSSSQCYKRHGD